MSKWTGELQIQTTPFIRQLSAFGIKADGPCPAVNLKLSYTALYHPRDITEAQYRHLRDYVRGELQIYEGTFGIRHINAGCLSDFAEASPEF